MNKARVIELATLLAEVDYSSEASVARGNKAAIEIRALILESCQEGAQAIDELLGLLTHEHAGAWVAFTVLETNAVSDWQKSGCLKVIRSVANGSGLQAPGAKMWLEQHGHAT